MHLQPCSEPSGRLDPAPLTVLCGAAGAGHPGVQTLVEYSGFWGADDRYYLRRTVGRGTEWLVGTLEDRAEGEGEDAVEVDLPAPLPLARIAPLAAPAPSRPATRLMLVGRQHPGQRTRVAMQVCVRRVRHA